MAESDDIRSISPSRGISLLFDVSFQVMIALFLRRKHDSVKKRDTKLEHSDSVGGLGFNVCGRRIKDRLRCLVKP